MFKLKYSNTEQIEERVRALLDRAFQAYSSKPDVPGTAQQLRDVHERRIDRILACRRRMVARFLVTESLARGVDMASVERIMRSAGWGDELRVIGFIDALCNEEESRDLAAAEASVYDTDEGRALLACQSPSRIQVSVVRGRYEDECPAFSFRILGKNGEVASPVLGALDMGLYLFPSMTTVLHPDEFSCRDLAVTESNIPSVRERLRRALADRIPF